MLADMEERIVIADPVGDPQGYERELLALLGGQDPVDVLAATPAAVRERTNDLPEELLARRPAPGEWSVTELLGHLWNAEIAVAWRLRLILTHDAPRLVGWDQDAWARLPLPPFVELLDAFAALRAADVVVIRRAPEAAWERTGHHDERGRISFRNLVETVAGHDRAHLRQLERTIAAVRRRAPGQQCL
jgi:DinB superfamily